jgi:Domain of unknown function (DUF2760)
MSFFLACKAFWKAIKEPERAKKFLNEKEAIPQISQNNTENSHLKLLSLLQQAGRLIDFLKEDITSYSDEQVGSAVRKIHQDCNQVLEDLVTVRPIMEESEGATIRVPLGYDSATIKVTGKVKGEPPFTGILIHKGWKAHKHSLPKKIGDHSNEVISPAEIEVR